MIVFDTNVLSEISSINPDPAITEWSSSLDHPVYITAITVAEMRYGVVRLPEGKRKDALDKMVEIAIDLYHSEGRVLPFDESSTPYYARVLSARQKAGKPTSMADAQIAAICMANGFALATRNEKDFAETGVKVVNPWTEQQPNTRP
ncbi:MAG: type II toxin-antitoxin system VapC family toxin [Microbacteriaceae bacterium]|nr:type II toxin-antitoxin system VapC family toxin [Microbacteriaceae bacterium]